MTGSVKISLIKGDITDQRVDAIVNAANENLMHGSGVAGAIVTKGGYEVQEDSNRFIQRRGPVKVKPKVHCCFSMRYLQNSSMKLYGHCRK